MPPSGESRPAPTESPAPNLPGSGHPILTRIDLRGVTDGLGARLPAPELQEDEGPAEAVRSILSQVRCGGDRALRHLTDRFDRVALEELRVDKRDLKAALAAVPAELRRALEVARDNIEGFYRSTLHPDGQYERDGVSVGEVRKPVARAGLYVPGGTAPLASTVLMTAVPARVAGVAELAMVTPPGPADRKGLPAAPILAAAAVAGVDEVYRVGGAQAIAALAYGTETIRPVDVIVGPGNVYVALAQRLVAQQGVVGVPSAFAGPSEVAVVADEITDVTHAAIDLVVQAEHGPNGFSWLVTWSEEVADRVTAEVARLTAESPRKTEIHSTLDRGGFAVLVDDRRQAMEVCNVIAAEHLELMASDPKSLVPMVRNAGAVFVGPWAPASVGDYVAGPSHVLPTARTARFASALRCDDFCRYIHVVEVSPEGLGGLAPSVEALATSEGLAAHAESVRLRVGKA
jgi:histidinol dehydrogenase